MKYFTHFCYLEDSINLNKAEFLFVFCFHFWVGEAVNFDITCCICISCKLLLNLLYVLVWAVCLGVGCMSWHGMYADEFIFESFNLNHG